MRILYIEHKGNVVELITPGGKLTIHISELPAGLNNNTLDQWELINHTVDTPLPFVKVIADVEFIFRPKEAI